MLTSVSEERSKAFCQTLESALSIKQTKTSFNWFSENKNAKTKDRDKHREIKEIPKHGKNSHSRIFLFWKGLVFQVTESTSVQKVNSQRKGPEDTPESPDLDGGKMKVGLFSLLQLAQVLRTARALMPSLGTTPLRLPFRHPRQQSDPSLISHEGKCETQLSHRKGERTRKMWFNNRHSEGVPWHFHHTDGWFSTEAVRRMGIWVTSGTTRPENGCWSRMCSVFLKEEILIYI